MTKRKKRQDEPAKRFEKGWTGGFTAYRYGSTKPISLAGNKHKPLHTSDQRKHLVNQIMNISRDWRQSPFEFEAPCRHGLRTSFCAEGHAWQTSDDEAAAIVAESLRMLGAERPTFDEGQRHFTTAADACLWCAGPLDESQIAKGRRFCSPQCAKLTMDRREFERRHWSNYAYVQALREAHVYQRVCTACGKGFTTRHPSIQHCSRACAAVSRQTEPQTITCEACGVPFKTKRSGVRFCSQSCVGISNRKEPDAVCRTCGTLFARVGSPTSDRRGIYCSAACRIEGVSTREIHVECEWCAKPFVSRNRKGRFCSTLCRGRSLDVRSGRWVPKQLSAGAFDHFFTKPVNEVHASRLTPQRFDWMLMERGVRITGEVKVAA